MRLKTQTKLRSLTQEYPLKSLYLTSVTALLVCLFLVSSLLSQAIWAQEVVATPYRHFVSQVIKISKEKDEAEKIKQLKESLISSHHLIYGLTDENEFKQIVEKEDIPLPQQSMEDISTVFSLFKEAKDLFNIDAHLPSATDEDEVDRQEKVSKVIHQIPDSFYQQFFQQLDEEIKNIAFSELPAVKVLRDPEHGINLKNAAPGFSDFLQIILEKYFDQFPTEDKKNLIISLIELPPHATDAQKLSVFLQSAGPTIQKFFQLIGEDVQSPILVDVMKELKSNIKPFPFEEAKKMIEQGYGKKLEEVFVEFNPKPVAAATIGQVHLAKIKRPFLGKQDVVVKLQRPGIEEKAARELKILYDLAPNEGTRKIVQNLKEAMDEELDFTHEANNMRKGLIYRHRFHGLHSAGTIKQMPALKNILVQEKAQGKSINKFGKIRELEKRQKALNQLLKIWLKEALFKSGFLHADLHAGNVFFTNTASYPYYKMTLIDFGSTAHLTKKEKKGIIYLTFGILLESAETIVEAFSLFDPMSEETKTKFSEKINQILANEELKTGKKTQEILSYALELGINFPKNFIQFNRGKSFIDRQIAEVQKQLDLLDPRQKKVKRINPKNTYIEILIKGLSPDLSKYFLKVGKGSGLLEQKTIKKLMEEKVKPLLSGKLMEILHPHRKKCLSK